MTHRTEIAGHFVDSSTLSGSVSGFGGALKEVGTEWNRTTDSRMALTDRQDCSLERTAYGAAMCDTNSALYIWHSNV